MKIYYFLFGKFNARGDNNLIYLSTINLKYTFYLHVQRQLPLIRVSFTN